MRISDWSSDVCSSDLITHDSFWRLFCEAVGHPEWVGSPEHGTISARSRNRARVIADVSAALAQRTTEEWLERLLPLGIVVAGIKTLDQALHSEQTRRSEEHTSELQSLMRISYAGFCLKK